MSGPAPALILVMGVSGSGKSTIGALLAARLNMRFLDADSLHPHANIAKMAAGIALDDADRGPWLDALAEAIHAELASGRSLVLACSALKRSYRDHLRRAVPAAAGCHLVYLEGTAATLADRLHQRYGHFMPEALLRSQLDALEAPTADEAALVVPIDAAPDTIVTDLLQLLPAARQTAATSP